ncbi:hypothetical protein BMS3Abin17_01345 [archaeon BMS3Abin17]|nr:hypothetical protein BMS3Abin17_01345 [archaeon BMS3Abin17]HDZ60923.1 hypothetical protein [Candidatus Pacearchaeota archaeon]
MSKEETTYNLRKDRIGEDEVTFSVEDINNIAKRDPDTAVRLYSELKHGGKEPPSARYTIKSNQTGSKDILKVWGPQ